MTATPTVSKLACGEIKQLQAKDEMFHKLQEQVIPVNEHASADPNPITSIVIKKIIIY